jgi:HAD superfamily hydrolase (TIGR01509 family)
MVTLGRAREAQPTSDLDSPAMPAEASEVAAVVFDLDGVLLDSETTWVEAKREFTEESGGRWQERAQLDMLGMSSIEWSRYMHDELGVPVPPERISSEVAERLVEQYRQRLPLLPGAVEAVRALARDWPLALATSSNRNVIDLALEESELTDAFAATVSSEEVERGKPAPDVYLEAARRLNAEPSDCVAIEDSANGIRSAHAAGMAVIAIPNKDFPPEPDALALAALVLDSLEELGSEQVRGLVTA